MIDREKVKYDIERCICHVPDACRDCSHYKHGEYLDCMEELLKDALALLKEQDETIKELQSAYDYLQKQFFEAQDKLLTQDSVEHACDILRANGWKETEPLCSECNAVHVVLCKDCKHGREPILAYMKGCVWCERVNRHNSADWFCADGEKDS